MDDSGKKDLNALEKAMEDKLSKYEESVLGKVERIAASKPRSRFKYREEVKSSECSAVCPTCYHYCGESLGHYGQHHCFEGGHWWDEGKRSDSEVRPPQCSSICPECSCYCCDDLGHSYDHHCRENGHWWR